MKKFYAILCLAIASLTQLQAQAPQGFNYQATVRNSSGDLIINTNVYFKFNVIQGSETAVPIFTETHYVPTDDLGQVNLVIGQGTANTGVFSELDWSLGSYYLGIELDTGNGYVAMGTTQLLSVPYAMYAENSGLSSGLPSGGSEGQVICIVNGVPTWVDYETLSPCGDEFFTQTWYIDEDGDGYGFSSGTSCLRPENGFLLNELTGNGDGTDDCDDSDADEFPGQNWFIDTDGDGYGGSSQTSCLRPENGFLLNELTGNGDGTDDCDDSDTSIYPGAEEVPDGIDNDCDGEIDNGFDEYYCPPSFIVYGTQKWSSTNACNITYRDGTAIPQVADPTEWSNITTGAWCYYENDPTKPKLYNWYAIMGIHDSDPNTPNKEFAPEGWHLPNDEEWTTFVNYLIENGYNFDGTTTGNKIAKAISSTTGWDNSTVLGAPGNEQSSNNSSGFNAYPEGSRSRLGPFGQPGTGKRVIFWSSSVGSSFTNCCAVAYSLYGSNTHLGSSDYYKKYGFSVRFVKD